MKDSPWEEFVPKPPVDNWHNPWAQLDPILATVSKLPPVKTLQVERIVMNKIIVLPHDQLEDFLDENPELRKYLFRKKTKKKVY